MSVVETNNLCKTFKISGGEDIEVLCGINFKAKPGEFIAIMGASGSGKSTLLNILSSIETSTSGTVIIDNVDLSKANEKTLVKARRETSSIIYQDFHILPYLTALENVMFPLLISGKDEKVAQKKAHELLEKVGLDHLADHPPDDLSGGEKQRVGIARALINDPRILLADEPTGNLDTRNGNQIMKLFRELVKQGITIIMVTHDVKLAKKTDKILILKDGVLFKEEEVMDEI